MSSHCGVKNTCSPNSDDEGSIGSDIGNKTLTEAFLDVIPSDVCRTTGSFHFSKTIDMAPFPCLRISNLGTIGLPLSKQDAHSIISSAEPVPSHHGRRTTARRNTANIWEIAADRVSFGNPRFLEYLRSLVLKDVAEALGVKPFLGVQRDIELDKLLLYRTGSCVPPAQESEKSKGMFATILVVLPSPYTGGEICVTHNSDTQVLDFSATSRHSLSILSWYTSVMQEVKPVTSGSKLALSFNFVQRSPNVPLPSPPTKYTTLGKYSEIRHFFRRWKKGLYAGIPRDNLLILPLEDYDEDSREIEIMDSIAQEEGFTFLLANFEHQIHGRSEEGDVWCRTKDSVRMGEIDHKTATIADVTDLDGEYVFGKRVTRDIHVDEDCFVPPYYLEDLEDEEPNEDDFQEGYLGARDGTLVQTWERRVLVILPKSGVDALLFRA